MTYCPSSLYTPAPDQYNIGNSTLSHSGISLSGRFVPKQTSNTPAAAEYTPSEEYTTKRLRAPAFSISKKTKNFEDREIIGPGPAYLPSLDHTTRKSNASAVIQERHPTKIANGIPAPNWYDTRPDIKKETPYLSFSGRFEQKSYINPGVGSYDLRGEIQTVGCKIQQRYSTRSYSNPGPGQYNITRYSAFAPGRAKGSCFHSRMGEKQGMYLY